MDKPRRDRVNDLALIKSAKFGQVQCDFYKNTADEILMTREQIGVALEYAYPQEAIQKIHERNKDRLDKFSAQVKLTSTDGKLYDTYVYTTKGIYEICRFSRQPKADAFMDWVWDVIEDIRKHGMYATDNVIDNILNNPDFGIKLLTTLKEERQKRLETEKTNHILMHVNKTYTATEIAKELGFKSAIALNEDLMKKHIQFKQNGTWVLYSQYADKGYTEIKQEVLDSGRVVYHRKWTQIGREFLLKLYGIEEVAI
jgi:prophage antirepressor-like protein